MFNHRSPQAPIDKGWAQMKAQLDQEMPRQRRRRLLPWWFSAFTFAGGVVAGILLSGIGQNKRTNSDHTVAQAQVAHHSRQQAPQITSTVAARSWPVAHHPATTIAASKGATPPYETASPLKVPLATSVSALLSVAAPERLSAPALPLIFTPTPSPEFTPVPVTTVSRKRQPATRIVRLGLLAGANAFQVRQVPGWLGGVTIDFSGRRQRWGLSTGLIYRHQEFSGENRPVIPISYDRYQSATASKVLNTSTIPVASLYAARTNRILIPVMTSHQLEVPLMAFWQPFSRWRWYGGGALARHVWVESAANGLFTYDLRVVTTPDPDAAGNLNTAIKNQLPPWEFNWQSGIAFKPMRRLEVGLFYRSVWTGKAALADVDQLFGNCISCADKYPDAESRTRQSLRPQSLQFSVSYKF